MTGRRYSVHEHNLETDYGPGMLGLGRERVYLVLAYAKGAKETLTRAEENELRELATQLETEEC